MQKFCLLLLASIALTALQAQRAVCAEADAGPQGEAAAIRAAAKDYLAAARRGDADALGKMWTPEGDYVDASGQVFKAQELIRQQAAARRSNAAPAPVDATLPKSSLRFVTPSVAIEDGTFDLGTAADGNILSGRYTATWVKRDGRWLLDALREAATATAPRNENLRPLEWLLGEWVGATEDSVILVSSHWSDGGNYIVREFVVRGSGGEVTATERIGWDPVAREFRSWTFDSQDGRGDGRWRRDGNRWIVEISEVLPDGTNASTSAIVTPRGDGHFVWEVNSAKAGDVSLPSQPRVEFKRAPENE